MVFPSICEVRNQNSCGSESPLVKNTRKMCLSSFHEKKSADMLCLQWLCGANDIAIFNSCGNVGEYTQIFNIFSEGINLDLS